MRKIREVLRLYFAAALSIRAIARSLGTSPSTVGEYLRRAKVAGVSWPVPEAIDDAGLERRLFPALPSSHTSRPLPDWSEVRRELRGKNVTLALLWQEYKAIHPEGLQYSRFCEQYWEWAGKLDLVMRQEHRAGEKLFLARRRRSVGQHVPVDVGEVRRQVHRHRRAAFLERLVRDDTYCLRRVVHRQHGHRTGRRASDGRRRRASCGTFPAPSSTHA